MRPSSLRREAQGIDETLGDRDADGGDRERATRGHRWSSGSRRAGIPSRRCSVRKEPRLALKECIDRQWVLIRFVQTRGPTELCVRLDEAASQSPIRPISKTAEGSVHLEGDLTLNGVPRAMHRRFGRGDARRRRPSRSCSPSDPGDPINK